MMNAFSDRYMENMRMIGYLKDEGKIDSDRAILLNWINNLEGIAHDIVKGCSDTSIRELDEGHGAAKRYEKKMVESYGRKYHSEVGFAISRYNAILRKGKVGSNYFLGENK